MSDSSPHLERNLADRIARVRLLAFDVDGVLTDGAIYMDGEREFKRFDVHDGAGIAIAIRAGFHVVWISGRKSNAVAQRAKELDVEEVYQGETDKVAILREVGHRLGVLEDEMLFMGDDLPDLLAFRHVGLAAVPSSATPDARSAAHFIASSKGGCGAVREVIEMVIRNQHKWDEVVDGYLRERQRLAQ